MLVTCPQCHRSIEAPTARRGATTLLVCPCCGKFAARSETPEDAPKSPEAPKPQWMTKSP